MNEDDQPLFSSSININYDMRFVRVAQDFVENLSALAGANEAERLKISLLVEECLVFIIDKYIDCRTAAHIQICFMVFGDKKICLEITDIGPPIHESMIPSFDITDENSEAGLWYKVARELADEFAFVNQYRAGWLVRIGKRIEAVTFGAGGEAGGKAAVGREQTFGEKHLRPAKVADIPALIDLAYLTYRYTYEQDFYDEVTLKRYIEEKLYDITVVEHGSKVIGAYAMKYSDAAHSSAELGSAMISPEYRSASAGALILREISGYVQANPYDCAFFMSTAVTSHARSQRMLARVHNGFKPLNLCLNMLLPPEFIGINDRAGGRESLLFVYHLNHALRAGRLYATAAKHLPITSELLAQTGSDIEVRAEFAEPETLESQISIRRFDSQRFAIISIESLGKDWFTALGKAIFSAIVAGVESVKVAIPASTPLPHDMETKLSGLNLVFCGLSLRSLEKVDHVYCLTTKPVDFGQIKLHDPVAQKLLAHIEQTLLLLT